MWFAQSLERERLFPQTTRIKVELYGSLNATGKGHGSDKAVLTGLEGDDPATIDTKALPRGAMVVISYRWTKSLKPCATQVLI